MAAGGYSWVMPKAKTAKTVNPLAALADELGALEAELAPLKPKAARVEALRKLFRASCADLAPTLTRSIAGEKFSVHIGPRENQRSVNTKKLAALVSVRVFSELATVTLGALDDLAPEISAQVIESDLTGSRPVNVIPVSIGKAA